MCCHTILFYYCMDGVSDAVGTRTKVLDPLANSVAEIINF